MHPDTRREGLAGGRLGLVGASLSAVLAGRAGATALDCGGGTGTFAVPLAQEGVDVTVVDISADALATLSRRAAEVGVAERVTPVAGDVEALVELQAAGALGAAGTFDLVLAHGILDAVDDVPGTFSQIASAVRPGGVLSVLVANPVAAVLGRALAGDLAAALRELSGERASAGPEHVRRLCDAHGLAVDQVQGIGVFADLVPGSALDQPGARAALAELEAACAQRSPFAEIAGRVHVLARRPG